MDIGEKLIFWYKKHRRELPWRQTNDPYRIWLSEIILQQTRVAQGLNYYERFTEAYPTLTDLAEAPEEEVLKLWQGLGYYSRARNLLKAARVVKESHEGYFPSSSSELKKLPGIGPYTSAAIASIAFNEAVPVVDGNVFRVLSRLYAISTPIDNLAARKEFEQAARALMADHKPGAFNQALMELGALVCTPVNPKCHDCPFQAACVAFADGNTDSYPVKARKVKQRKRFFHYFVVTQHEKFWLKKRIEKDIWQHLFDFPLLESEELLNPEQAIDEAIKKGILPVAAYMLKGLYGPTVHQLTHQRLEALFIELEINGEISPKSLYLSKARNELKHLSVPRLIHRFLEERKLV